MRLTSFTACPSAVAWHPVVSMAAMMPSKDAPSLKSQPLMMGVPSGRGAEATRTAWGAGRRVEST